MELMIDDGSAEGAFGVTGAAARQFMWFNQFTPTVAAPFFLDEIWVLFPPDQILVPGSEIELVVYLDEDGDPTNGATLLASIPEVVQATDGSSFSIYPVVPGIEIGAPGDVLIGVIARYIETGVTPPTAPAALDLSSSEGRSWLAIWTGDPPVAPDLPPDDVLDLIDIFEPSNFMIRGFGSLPVPAMPVAWLAMLAIFLAAGGFLLIRRG